MSGRRLVVAAVVTAAVGAGTVAAPAGLTTSAAAASVSAAAGVSTAAPAPGEEARALYGTPAPFNALHSLVDLSAQRLATADQVAAAKWGTGSPIDDPAREQQVLQTVAELARKWGTDPDEVQRIFRDQIEANKVVQRGLYAAWDADPSKAPTQRPDLAEVRKEINRINEELVRAIADSTPLRSAPVCHGGLAASVALVRREQRLDPLHTQALHRALPSVCRPIA